MKMLRLACLAIACAAVARAQTTVDESLGALGTAGAGFLQIANQSSAPSTPTTAGRLYWDSSNRLSWIGTNGFTRSFDGTANTANRVYTLPDSAIILTGSASALASGRVPFVTTGGILTDASTMTFSSGTLTLGTGVTTGTGTFSALTSGRVTVAGTAGLLADDSGLTYSTSTHNLTIGTSGSGLALHGGGTFTGASGGVTLAASNNTIELKSGTTPIRALLLNLSQQSVHADGLVGTPSVSFNGDTAMGLYNAGTNQLGVSIAGTQRAYFNASGFVVAGTGTFSGLTSGRVPFASTGGLLADASTFTFNSGTGTLSATTFSGAFSGTATNATNIGITDDTTTNATMYPLWVTANTGNLPAKVTSTKLSFNPSTGGLTATNHIGTFAGNTFTTGTGTLTIAAAKTLTANNTLTFAGTDSTTQTFPTTSATIARTDAAQSFTGLQTLLGSGATSGLKFGAIAAAAFGVSGDLTSSSVQVTLPTTGLLVVGAGMTNAQSSATTYSVYNYFQVPVAKSNGSNQNFFGVFTNDASNPLGVVISSTPSTGVFTIGTTNIGLNPATGLALSSPYVDMLVGSSASTRAARFTNSGNTLLGGLTTDDTVNALQVTGSAALSGTLKTGGFARVTSDVTNATATMSNLTNLSVTVVAGLHYIGTVTLFANDSTGADGLAFDLGGGSCTFTDLEFGFTAQPTGSTLGTVTSTTSTTAVTLTVVSTSDAVYTLSFGFTVNAAGTFIPRFAQNSHSAGTATVRKNSSITAVVSTN